MSNYAQEQLERQEKQESALDTQVGGDHYKNQGVQPFEATLANYGYKGLEAAVYNKVNKYIPREKGDKVENLEKAKHCIEILIDAAKTEALDEELEKAPKIDPVNGEEIPEGATFYEAGYYCKDGHGRANYCYWHKVNQRWHEGCGNKEDNARRHSDYRAL